MKFRNLLFYSLTLFCFLGFNKLEAQLVENLKISAEKADIQFIAPNSYLLEIAGPDNYYLKKEVEYTRNLSLSNIKADGKKFQDGSYMLQITPIVKLTEEEKVVISAIRADMDYEKMAAFRQEHNLPDQINVYNVNFSIRDGKFVAPTKEHKSLNTPKFSDGLQEDHPALYASIEKVMMDYGQPVSIETLPNATDDTAMSEDDQVFFDDVIVVGSICVGQDCVNGEAFGFDTIRLKENNLRIKFQDTSSSASFPTNDWQLTANDSSNGGANKFSIDDIDGGRTPFTIEAGARSNSLYVDDGGRVGFGTATPVVQLHSKDGNTPTLRLEQDGSSGFAQQTWDVAGNEANFFIRDATNGSTLPFRIFPGAPSNSLTVAASGNIGLGTTAPKSTLDVVGSLAVGTNYAGTTAAPTDGAIIEGNVGIGTASPARKVHAHDTGAVYFQTTNDVSGSTGVDGVVFGLTTAGKGTFLNYENTDFEISTNGLRFLAGKAAGDVVFYNAGVEGMRLDGGKLGIGTNSPAHQLELSQDDAAKPNGGTWTAASDRRLKTNIEDFNEGLDAILKIRPVRYNYNGKLDYPTEKRFIGVIAQEMREIAPYTVMKLKKPAPEGEEDYLAFDGTPVTYLLINAVQEQQEMIEAQKAEITKLQSELAGVQDLKAQVAALAEMVSELNETASSDEVEVESNGEKE